MPAQTVGPSLTRAARMALAVIPVAVLVRRLRIAAGMRRGDQAVIDAKRQRNKRFANKVVTRFGRAGRVAGWVQWPPARWMSNARVAVNVVWLIPRA